MKYIFLTNEAANKGYSTSVKALAATEPTPVIIDAERLNGTVLPQGATLVSAGSMGFELLKRYGAEHPMVLATDRYGFENLAELRTDCLTLIAPQCELDKYRAAGVVDKAVLVAADLVAAPSMETMHGYACNFFAQNDLNPAMFEFEWCVPEFFFFFGGRVAAPTKKNPDFWKENTVDQFERTAELLMEDASGFDAMVVFHGFRSRTRADRSNDFAPQEAAIAKIGELRRRRQKVLILATCEEGPTLIAIDNEGERRYRIENPNAGAYYAAIEMAVRADAPMEFTAEQMNFTGEALTLGADWTNLIPVGSEEGWDLVVEANEQTHDNVFGLLEEGRKPLTQVEAFLSVKE